MLKITEVEFLEILDFVRRVERSATVRRKTYGIWTVASELRYKLEDKYATDNKIQVR